MKSHTEHLTLNVPKRMDFINITPQVEQAVRQSGVREGLCLVNAMHITASVFINDDEPGLHQHYKGNVGHPGHKLHAQRKLRRLRCETNHFSDCDSGAERRRPPVAADATRETRQNWRQGDPILQ